MLEWSLDALRAAGIDEIVVALPDGRRGAARAASACAAARPARSRCAPRWPPRRAPARSSSTTPRGRWSTPELFTRVRRRAGGRRLRDRRRARDRHDQGGRRRRRRRRHARPLPAVGDPDAAGLPPRGAGGARSTSTPRSSPRATDDAWLVERAGGTVRVVESSPANFKITTPHDLRHGRAAPACVDAMLTDYHVHLRPDDPGTTAATLLHRRPTPSATARPPPSAASTELGVSEHIHRFTAALDVWEHPFWRQSAVDDLDRYVEFVREETDLRLGIEADYIRGREDRMANLLDAPRLGLRRRLGALPRRARGRLRRRDRHLAPRDRPPSGSGSATSRRSPSRALTGIYDIIAHPDLVKIWGSGRPAPDEGPALLLRARDRGDARRAAWRWRSPPPGCASRSARSTRRARCSRWRSTPACRSRCPATRTRPEHLAFGYEQARRAARATAA